MDKRIRNSKIIIIVMFFVGLFGIILLSYDYVNSKIRLTFETLSLELNDSSQPEDIAAGSPEEQKIIEENQNNQEGQSNQGGSASGKKTPYYNSSIYFGYIQIPKINLVQGLVKRESKRNNVNENIKTVTPSDYPDVEGGNLILAAHSGSSRIAYFKKLYKLSVNDQVHVVYNGERYIYNIVNIYEVPKNGKVTIYRNPKKSTVTLITCTKNNDKTQTVYISELIGKEGV